MSANGDELDPDSTGGAPPPEDDPIEFFDDTGGDVSMTIDNIEVPGVVEAVERGAGFTEEYRHEIEHQSGGTDEASEPPAARIDVTAMADHETWQQLNALREIREPFPVSIGPFAYDEMGISNLEKVVRADENNAIELHIKLKEYREVIIQERDLSEGDPGDVDVGEGERPDSAWVDETGDGRDDRTGEPIPEMSTDTLSNESVSVPSGTAFGRQLFNIASGTTGNLSTQGQDWSVQDVGFSGVQGTATNTSGAITVNEMGGSSLIRNVYIGDGAPMFSAETGSTGSWYRNTSTGHVSGELIHVAGWPDNGLYWSPPRNATSEIHDCFGYNNGVGSYRVRHSSMSGCVGNNDGGGHADFGGRVTWQWNNGTTDATDCDFVVTGGSSLAVVAGRSQSTDPCTINVTNSGVGGDTHTYTGGNINITGSRTPDPGNFHPRVPGSAMDAAAGEVPPTEGDPSETPQQ